ncbi:MAG: hypothetical protein ACC651_09590, partial [Candidatus Scalindua sp.]
RVKNIQKVKKTNRKNPLSIYNPHYSCNLLLNFHSTLTAFFTDNYKVLYACVLGYVGTAVMFKFKMP